MKSYLLDSYGNDFSVWWSNIGVNLSIIDWAMAIGAIILLVILLIGFCDS